MDATCVRWQLFFFSIRFSLRKHKCSKEFFCFAFWLDSLLLSDTMPGNGRTRLDGKKILTECLDVAALHTMKECSVMPLLIETLVHVMLGHYLQQRLNNGWAERSDTILVSCWWQTLKIHLFQYASYYDLQRPTSKHFANIQSLEINWLGSCISPRVSLRGTFWNSSIQASLRRINIYFMTYNEYGLSSHSTIFENKSCHFHRQ